MNSLRIYDKRQDSVIYVYGERNEIWTDPPYQRMSGIWPLEKRQLLIDSILNGFDIPKLYFHELSSPRKAKGTLQRHAIIDGKQRLESIWGFINGEFALSESFELFDQPRLKAAGLTYTELAETFPRLKSLFDATRLPIVVVETSDTELIEEMFSRLNEAVPLNAPEKRNAFGGAMPKAIRQVAKKGFFTKKLPYPNRRYRHFDLATKFLYIEDTDSIIDTKKV